MKNLRSTIKIDGNIRYAKYDFNLKQPKVKKELYLRQDIAIINILFKISEFNEIILMDSKVSNNNKKLKFNHKNTFNIMSKILKDKLLGDLNNYSDKIILSMEKNKYRIRLGRLFERVKAKPNSKWAYNAKIKCKKKELLKLERDKLIKQNENIKKKNKELINKKENKNKKVIKQTKMVNSEIT